jgi:hypothetical protein
MAALKDINDWMDEQSQPNVVWYVKRLAANDTLATGAHQAGPYMPKNFLLRMFPSLNRPDCQNSDTFMDLCIDSHHDLRKVRVIWYNNKHSGGTRNETRLTGFGGTSSALLDPDNTGALTIFAFHQLDKTQDAHVCHVWVCDDPAGVEADLVEERIGLVEPGKWRIWSVNQHQEDLLAKPSVRSSCWLDPNEVPSAWLNRFPTVGEIITKTIEMRTEQGRSVDDRLMRRRDCEFEIFKSLEQATELPLIKQGFTTIEEFIARAQTILQRRKARSGRSLELHVRALFLEEHLREGIDFSHQPESDIGKRPDFLFPSEAAYKNLEFPVSRLRMLAVKTTCKDRWRQVINEANRIQHKHLLTLQEGVSEGQFREMTGAGICLVVPKKLTSAYPITIQPHLQTLESFMGDIRMLNPLNVNT